MVIRHIIKFSGMVVDWLAKHMTTETWSKTWYHFKCISDWLNDSVSVRQSSVEILKTKTYQMNSHENSNNENHPSSSIFGHFSQQFQRHWVAVSSILCHSIQDWEMFSMFKHRSTCETEIQPSIGIPASILIKVTQVLLKFDEVSRTYLNLEWKASKSSKIQVIRRFGKWWVEDNSF
jgi:hypothetical protein